MLTRSVVAAASFAALLTTLGLAACSGSTTDPFGNRPRGLRISLNGSTVVRVDGTDVEGSLHTIVGEYSGQFIIIPVTSDGRVIPTEQGYTLEATIEDPNVATFVPLAPGAFEGEIVSLIEGSTTITFRVIRSGATGNLTYVAPPIDLITAACPPPSAGVGACSHAN